MFWQNRKFLLVSSALLVFIGLSVTYKDLLGLELATASARKEEPSFAFGKIETDELLARIERNKNDALSSLEAATAASIANIQRAKRQSISELETVIRNVSVQSLLRKASQETLTNLSNGNSTPKANEKEKKAAVIYPFPYRSDCCSKMPPCEATCFTKRACDDPAYPFRSEAEKKLFPQAKVKATRAQLKKIKAQCQSFDNILHQELEERKCIYDKIDVSLVPSQCTVAGMWSAHTSAFSRMMIFPEGKLAFCGIPKTGVTRWLQFLRFYIGANDYQSMPHFKHDREELLFDGLESSVQTEILNDPTWTKAVFIRNPLDRTLSAFIEKIEKSLQITDEGLFKGMSFEDFVGYLEKKGVGWNIDPHFQAQILACGLYKWLPQFQFVGSLDNVSRETKCLLTRVGLWEKYGKKYQNSRGKGNICARAAPPVADTVPTGFQQSDTSGFYSHATSARKKRAKYYTPELEERVKKVYEYDYKLYQIILARENNSSCGFHGKELSSSFCKN